MDYKDISNLMYMATMRIWLNPANGSLYESDAPRASEDCWDEFFRLVELNGRAAACSDYLVDEFLVPMYAKEEGRNPWICGPSRYPWEETAFPLFYASEGEYPLYYNALILAEAQLERDDAYLAFADASKAKLAELERIYES